MCIFVFLTTLEYCDMVCVEDRAMGRLPTGNRKYQIDHIWNVHHEVKRLALLGMKSVDIARTLNVSEAMVSYTLNSTIVRRELDIMRGARDLDALEVSRSIKALAPQAVEVLSDMLAEGNIPQLRLAAAKDVLDRSGHPAVRGVEVSAGKTFLTRDEIADIKQRAKSIGLTVVPSESVIDIPRDEGESEKVEVDHESVRYTREHGANLCVDQH